MKGYRFEEVGDMLLQRPRRNRVGADVPTHPWNPQNFRTSEEARLRKFRTVGRLNVVTRDHLAECPPVEPGSQRFPPS